MPPTPLSSVTCSVVSFLLERAFALGSFACLQRSSPAACSTFSSPRRYSATWPIPAASPQMLLRVTARIQLPLRHHSLQCRIATISQYDTATVFGKSSLRLVTHSAVARLPRSLLALVFAFCAWLVWLCLVCWFVLLVLFRLFGVFVLLPVWCCFVFGWFCLCLVASCLCCLCLASVSAFSLAE